MVWKPWSSLAYVGIALFSLEMAKGEGPNFGKEFLGKYCVACHSGQNPKAELSLSAWQTGDDWAKNRKSALNVLKMVAQAEMPPEGKQQPSVEERAALQKWVEAAFAFADQHAKPDPGRVTMRRLNRTEYKNTVRDLIGVDFDPTQDFPSDDIGHGFDNIGDVLTLSPVLMERYLAAAENIMTTAIMPNPPQPTKRYQSSQYCEPAGGNVKLEGRYRPIASDATEPVFTGPLNTPYKWEDDGVYIFRSRVYAQTEGQQPVRVAMLVHGPDLPDPDTDEDAATLVGNVIRPFKILKTVDITAVDAKKPQMLEVTVPAMPGRHRTSLAIVKPAEGQPPVKLYIEHLALEGPLDPRPASHRRLLACTPDRPQAEQTREVFRRFLPRAYRRPVTEDEVNRVVAVVEAAQKDEPKWESAMQVGFQAVLCSPKFLFRVELDDRPQHPDARPLDEFQLASRLSYFLWSSLPDDELRTLAEQQQLTANLEPQVKRMLQDTKSTALVHNFAVQWLQIQRLTSFSPDPTLFPRFDERLRQAMLQETVLFFESVVREDRSILDLLDANYTFVNEPLARLYGIADTNGNYVGQKPVGPRGQQIRGEKFQRVTLQDKQRGGLLTQASILTVTSNPTRTSPVKRGRWVLEQLLGAPPPPPPPNVPELPNDEKAIAGGSLRQRLELHRANPACANCHAKMDPLGFALENYDAIGTFRTKDGAFDIDPSGQLPDGETFQGTPDLKTVLLNMKGDFARCLAEKMTIYALGRGLEYYDRRAIDRMVAELEKNDYRFSTLVVEIVKSEPFRQRRGTTEN